MEPSDPPTSDENLRDEARRALRSALRGALWVGMGTYLLLKWTWTSVDAATSPRLLARWLTVCADHPVRCAAAAALAALALTSFVRAGRAPRPGPGMGDDL